MSDVWSPDEEALRARWASEDAAWEAWQQNRVTDADDIARLFAERNALRAQVATLREALEMTQRLGMTGSEMLEAMHAARAALRATESQP